MQSELPAETASLGVIVPVHDEAQSLATTLRAIREANLPPTELVVVDDASSDGSAEIARALGVRVVRHEQMRGYGASLKTGLELTRARHVAIIDADGSYAPSDLERLCQALPESGMVVGARQEPSPVRRFFKALLCLQVRLITGAPVPDLNSGLRIFDRRVAARLSRVLPDRFSFTTTLTLGALALGVPVRFLPVQYRRRSSGRSKFTLLDALRMARTVARGCRWVHESSIERATASNGRVLRWLVCAAVLSTLIWLAPRTTWHEMLYPAVLGAALYLPFFLFKVLRWQRLLASTGVSLRASEAIRAYLTGLAIGAVTPGRAGEFARVAGPHRRGHPLGPLVLATVTDRVMDLAVIAGVALGAACHWALDPSWVVTAAGTTFGAAMLVTTAPLLTRFALTCVLKLRTPVPRIATAALLGALGWTALSMSLFFVMALVLMRGSGVSAPTGVLLGAIAAGNLAAIVPISVGGIGSREGAILATLAAAGFATGASTIASYALAFHLVFTLTPWVLLCGAELAKRPATSTTIAARLSA